MVLWGIRSDLCVISDYGEKTPHSDYPQMVRGSQRAEGLTTDQRRRETMGSPVSREAHGHRVFIVVAGVTPCQDGWESQP